MARESGTPILAYLQNARSYSEQAAALRVLKNDIVGHLQKKEAWVQQGALEPVVALLLSSRPSSKAANGKPMRSMDIQTLGEEDTVRLQALHVLGSFASGGTPFFAPISAAGGVNAVLANISPSTNPPAVVMAAIKALLHITDACASLSETRCLADELFLPRNIQALSMLCTRSPEWHLRFPQSPTMLVADLICRLCHDDKHALALAESDIMDILATELASFAVEGGYVMLGAEIAGRSDGRAEFIPKAASSDSDLALILEALTVIVSDSKYRACRLLYSPAILAIFPREVVRPRMDFLLPDLPRSQGRAPLSAFPPLVGSAGTDSTQPLSRYTTGKFGYGMVTVDSSQAEGGHKGAGEEADDHESHLIPWLILLVRTCKDVERLMAANLLTTLFKSGFESRHRREAVVALLVVPVLVQMLQEANTASQTQTSFIDKRTQTAWRILEVAPAVLSRLITDSEPLQKAAYDCEAVDILSTLLKNAYEPAPSSAYEKMWSPNPDTGMDVESGSAACQLGPRSQTPVLAHRIKLRESTLKAIASLAAGKDEYRKALVDQDLMPYIVQSLSTNPTKPSPKDRAKADEPDGMLVDSATSGYGSNPLSVIIAACHAVRTHSRSISILRTSLVDHNVALPILRFLGHPDVDVQIAASAAICNLVTDVSPLREVLEERGVMKILCEHAHSHTAALRLNAMWALKHFVNGASISTKKQCLEELQSGWLVRLICDDTEDEALYKLKQETSEGADSGDDLDGDVEMADSISKSWYGSAGFPRDAEGKPAAWAVQAEAKKAAFRDLDVNPQRKARNDDLAIQEQGLDFIRNLIASTSSSLSSEAPNESTEMIDHLFQEVGQDRFFDILAKKLQAKMLHGGPRRGGAGGGPAESRIVYPQTKIIEAVIYNLVHIAASAPRHRALVIAHRAVLELLAGHFASRDKEVRVALCHLVNNLTWQDDEDDARSCAVRAHELRNLGILGRLEQLEADPDLDVRERAKTALWQMKQVSSA